MITNQRDLRAQFWRDHLQFRRRATQKQNDYPAGVRTAWVDYVDHMARSGSITEALAQRATL